MIAAEFNIHPEELLYSALARFGCRMRYLNPKTLREYLFGSTHSTFTADLGTRVDAFLSRLAPDHGLTALSLIWEHTQLPYYAHFLPPKWVHLAEVSIRGADVPGTRRALGLQRTQDRRPPCLAYCPDCFSEDLEGWGEASWRRVHQLPGVIVCPVHRRCLYRTRVNNVVLDGRPLVALNGDTIAGSQVEDVQARAEAHCVGIAQDSQALLVLRKGMLGERLIRQRLRSILAAKGYIGRRKVRLRDLRADVRAHFGVELLDSIRCGLGANMNTDWVGQVVRAPYRSHPLHYILVLRFLDCSPHLFFSPLQHLQPDGEPGVK
jgi:hypothetical protein